MMIKRNSTLLFALALAVMPGIRRQANASTFTVNSTDDASDAVPGDGICATTQGVCTLRAAIQEANALPGTDTIAFAIGSGAQTVNLTSALPTVTDSAVIDGTTQPGYASAPLIELNGSGTKGQSNGVKITAGNSTVQGLAINRFPANGILLSSGGNVVAGCYIGTDVTGTIAMANAKNGVEIDGPNNLIGGTTAAARNVISGNSGTGGILISGKTASGNIVQGNYIGTDATGTTAIPNGGRGIAIQGAPNNLIGGTAPGARNVISGNVASGIRTYVSGGDGNIIQGNFIGTDATGTVRIGNSRGVQLRTNNNLVGGSTPGAGNVIEGSAEGVIFASDSPTGNTVQGNVIAFNGRGLVADQAAGTGNAILGNSIFSNQGLGIDLWPFGVTANDPGDSDTGPNNLQNFPVLTSAASSPGTTLIMGTLNSTANTTFTVQLFSNAGCDSSGFGEGKNYLGQTTVATDGTGNAAFTVSFPIQVAVGQVITSTATDPGGNSSEFSACKSVTGA